MTPTATSCQETLPITRRPSPPSSLSVTTTAEWAQGHVTKTPKSLPKGRTLPWPGVCASSHRLEPEAGLPADLEAAGPAGTPLLGSAAGSAGVAHRPGPPGSISPHGHVAPSKVTRRLESPVQRQDNHSARLPGPALACPRPPARWDGLVPFPKTQCLLQTGKGLRGRGGRGSDPRLVGWMTGN